jgi:repressor LexA
MVNLTPRQRQILDFIKQEVQEKNYPPSVREIGNEVGLSSSSTVHSHLNTLEKKGLIRRDPTKPRAIEILGHDQPPSHQQEDVVRIPVLGQVAAGSPILAEENIEDYFPVPASLVKGDKVFMLRIRGDSMQDVGIYPDDYVIVRQQNSAIDNDIVVALLEDEATVKRFKKKKDHVVLIPENKMYEPLIARDVKILGKVIGLFRRIH